MHKVKIAGINKFIIGIKNKIADTRPQNQQGKRSLFFIVLTSEKPNLRKPTASKYSFDNKQPLIIIVRGAHQKAPP